MCQNLHRLSIHQLLCVNAQQFATDSWLDSSMSSCSLWIAQHYATCILPLRCQTPPLFRTIILPSIHQSMELLASKSSHLHKLKKPISPVRAIHCHSGLSSSTSSVPPLLPLQTVCLVCYLPYSCFAHAAACLRASFLAAFFCWFSIIYFVFCSFTSCQMYRVLVADTCTCSLVVFVCSCCSVVLVPIVQLFVVFC